MNVGTVNGQRPDAKPGHYYVTARQGQRTAFLLGPYTQERHGIAAHVRALALVRRARVYCDRNTREGRFGGVAYGTSRLPLEVETPIAKLDGLESGHA